MNRYKAEKEIHALVPDAWVKQRTRNGEIMVTAYTPSGGKWTAIASNEANAWHSLVLQVRNSKKVDIG